MKSFFGFFRSSAEELKNIRCLTVTGILIAVFIVLDMASIRIGDFIKINFAFAAIAAVGMFFGPVPAVLAALAGDLIGCILGGQAPLPLLSCTAMLEGFIYGVCLYKKEKMKLIIFSIAARLLDSLIVSLALNTAILMHYNFMTRTAQQFYARCGKISAELVFFIPLMIALMPALKTVYGKVVRRPQDISD